MLYVSRLVGRYSFEIVDTDDNTVESATHQDIVKATNLGVAIEGVSLVKSMTFFGSQMIKSIEPYQLDSELTQMQVKAKVMLHVDVKLYKGVLTQLTWDVDDWNWPVSIRLSDFAAESSDRVLYGNPVSESHRVTLIFDDKFKVSDKALYVNTGLKDRGFKFDIREVTDYYRAMSIYKQLLEKQSYGDLLEDILDDESRKRDVASKLLIPREFWSME